MIEHRRIEKMLRVMELSLRQIETNRLVDPVSIDIAVDFIRIYADRCHHGKEEDILFRELEGKPLSQEHRTIMGELIEEHKWGRETTAKLVAANQLYRKGEEKALSQIIALLKALIDFYPRHIEKEDKRFFIPVMRYFSQEEKDRMLKVGYEFDMMLIHEKYESVIKQAERDVCPGE
jgi:hemerythrin-like domain-containing protein